MSSAWSPRFTRAECLFSLKSFIAAMLALYIASRTGLPRPFWAVVTTYVVAHPLASNVRSKALYRFCGTLIGCVATLFMVPALSNAPVLLMLALGLWLGVCLYLSLLDRTARSYVFMLAGYTAALIGFPSVETPFQLFDSASARVEEIGLGILCGTIVHSLVFPAGLAPSVLGLLDRSLSDARRWLADMVTPFATEGVEHPMPDRDKLIADRQRLAADVTQLRLLATHVPFDTSHLQWTTGAIRAMQEQVAALTPGLSAVEDRLKALVQAEGDLRPDVVRGLGYASDWLKSVSNTELGAETDAAIALEKLRAELWRLGQGDGIDSSDWGRALRIGLATRLEQLVDGWRECAELRRTIDEGLHSATVPKRRYSGFGKVGNVAFHRDHGMALLSGFAAFLAVCFCCTVWIWTAWPSGAAAATMAAVFCSFFATMDNPVPAIKGFMKYCIYSIPLAIFIVLVVVPLMTDYWSLVFLCAPFLLIFGAYAARPATSLAGTVMILFGVTGTLALHDTSNLDIGSFLNGTLGQILGIASAALITSIVRTVGSEWSANRIRKATRGELIELAGAQRLGPAHEAYAVRMLDRIALLAPRIAQADPQSRNDSAEEALRDLRVGADIVALQRLRASAPSMAIDSLMRSMTRFFRAKANGRPDDASLLPQLDEFILGELRSNARSKPLLPTARESITALVGLRRNLFPEAPAMLAARVLSRSGRKPGRKPNSNSNSNSNSNPELEVAAS